MNYRKGLKLFPPNLKKNHRTLMITKCNHLKTMTFLLKDSVIWEGISQNIGDPSRNTAHGKGKKKHL